MQIRFATVNLFNYLAPPSAFYEFNNIYDENQWNKKKQWLDRKLSVLDADVIGFQEIFSAKELEIQLKELGYAHFFVVDQPKISDEYIYTHPVVGIASRYELTGVEAIEVDKPNSENAFNFYRKPLRATLNHPIVGKLDVYIVHFKSQRPTSDRKEENSSVFEAWQQETYGNWISTVQRGFEAALLHQEIMERKRITGHPVVLMGDFNQILDSQEFACLRSTHRFRQPDSYLPLLPYQLLDSWELYCHTGTAQRKPTHYTGASGQVLDYILLSSDFGSETDHNIARVINFHVEDQHLINPNFELDQFASDHAFVAVTLELRT
ncbi:endonuclease/exonuclease/phosphatase family protein [Vibrio ziniensis]|uniref:Endonuclease/exonuclease/phosphatase family protein n=1 Tax=Vibrio ziniensis TaxID=2711221 RepID=A0A6G7CNI1_9VIBR|nr:endonuclease/exonuclease/phosphatase family protein [Vibrio ziniensis]QIH43630.1 endonuclease/exonuclease/phosphatase family protein [Vibrio ziniensis]